MWYDFIRYSPVENFLPSFFGLLLKTDIALRDALHKQHPPAQDREAMSFIIVHYMAKRGQIPMKLMLIFMGYIP